MFTGIVREVGEVLAAAGGPGGVRLEIRAPIVAASTGVGDSVAVAGVCLTAVAVADGAVAFDAVPETLARTSLSRLGPGAAVNLEPALRAGEPLGGHIVSGHVDGLGTVLSLEPEGDGMRLAVELPPELVRYCVEKGSVALEGVSLTVAKLAGSRVEIALVPHTLAATTLASLRPGDPVNVEADMLAKYVERLVPGLTGR